MESEVRPIDQARAAQLVMSQLTHDPLMFAATFQDIVDDDFGLGELGSLVNVLRMLSADLAGAMVDVHGEENAEDLVRVLLARLAGTPPEEG